MVFLTIEVEYILITKANNELLCMEMFLEDQLGHKQENYIFYCDSESVIHLSKKSTLRSRSKHIDVRYNWIRDVLEMRLLQFEKIDTNENGSDMMTKPHIVCRRKIGLRDPHI